MLLSLHWLKDFVDIPKSVAPADLALRLTNHTVEVDSVKSQAEKFDKIVVGKILEIKKHPDADRLQLVKVDVGAEKLEIVCGASNIKVGQFVPVALVGAVLPNGLEIKDAKVRGVKSCGMMCAEDELGLGPDHSGIMILEKAKAGQELDKYLKLEDVIFEVDNKSITHRGDLWSHYGMAREVAAFLGTKFKEHKIKKQDLIIKKPDTKLSVKIENFDLCPRYMGIVVDGVTIKDSPKWMQERLIAVGMRPINNIVDITNYVLLELGQPMHAFDKSLVDKIVVRKAHGGEVLETLDGEKRELDNSMLIIADSKQPIAIAGIMGGASSEINHKTETIILESANFDFASIRKTTQKLGLRTESSIRFEKSLDPNLSEQALIRAVELIKKLCPQAKIISNLVDEKKFNLNQGPIDLDLEWLSLRIGGVIKEKEVKEILGKLGFALEKNGNKFKVTVPTWRASRDILSPEDLVEEVVRIWGYNNLEPIMPKVEMRVPAANKERRLERKIKNILSRGAGLTEAYNYSFVGQDQLDKLGIDNYSAIKLANPIAIHYAMLRPSMAINLFNNIKINQAREENIALFEVGNISLNSPGDINKCGAGEEKLPYQEKHLGIILADNNTDVFRQLKGVVSYLLESLGFTINFSKAEVVSSWSEAEKSALILAGGRQVGTVAGLAKNIGQKLGIKKEVVLAEISLRDLFALSEKQEGKKYQELTKFPPVVRDLAFVINEKILYNDFREEIVNFDKTIKQVELFDVYRGEKLGQGKKSLAFNMVYQADRTLTSSEVDKIQAGLIKELEKKFGAKIRDF